MNTKDLILIAIPVIVVLGFYKFTKSAIPGAVDALNASPVGTVAGGVMGVIQSAENYSDPAIEFGESIGDWTRNFFSDAFDGLSNVGD